MKYSQAQIDEARRLYNDYRPIAEIMPVLGTKESRLAWQVLRRYGVSSPEMSIKRRSEAQKRARADREPIYDHRDPETAGFVRLIPAGAFKRHNLLAAASVGQRVRIRT